MQVGFIGTGNMGRYMAASLIKGGHKLTVHDKRKAATDELVALGAVWADNPRAVAAASQVTITSLPGPAEVEAVALGPDGIFAGAGRGHFYVDMTTNAPTTARKVAAAGAAKGIDVLDAPVSGGTRGARQGKLTIMVGGSQAAFEACQPVF
ncbi:MAG: NAD(P)-binding domain-containing protein, partial [Chloroflexota bacterium]